MHQQDSDAEDHQQQSDLMPDDVNSAMQQSDDSGDDHISHTSMPTGEEEDDESHHNQQYEQSQEVPDQVPHDTQTYRKTLPSTSGKATYPMKSKRNVSRVHLIVADDDEGAIGEEGEGIHTCVCVCVFVHEHVFMHLYVVCVHANLVPRPVPSFLMLHAGKQELTVKTAE